MSIRAQCDLQKKLSISIRAPFYVNSGAIIVKSKYVGRHFCSDFQGVLEGSERFCPDFRGFCPDFMGLWRNFHQIKAFRGAVAPPAFPPPTPVMPACSINSYTTLLQKH